MTGCGWSVFGLALVLAAGPAQAQCKGDFNGDDAVTIDELVIAVENALDGCDAGPARFADNGDGTITDRHSALMWEKKVSLDGAADDGNLHDADNTYQWAGQCVPSDGEVFCQPSAAALAQCPAGAPGCAACPDGLHCEPLPSLRPSVFAWVASLNAAAFAGHQDWRVPTLVEIEGLADRARANPAVDPAFAGGACGAGCDRLGDPSCSCTSSLFYWSSTPLVSDRPRVWTVRFDAGAVDGGALSFDVGARAVRTAGVSD
jgi:hypothetical protein